MSLRLSIVPAFPLSIAVLPGEVMPLHVFEPRYKQLVTDCFEQKKPFAIPFVEKTSMLGWGSLVLIKRIDQTYPNGECDVSVEGLMPFKLADFKEFMSDKLYGSCSIYTEDLADNTADLGLGNKAFGLLSAYLPHQAIQLANANIKADSYRMAAMLQLPQKTKYEYMSLSTENERLKKLINEIKILIQIRKNEEAIEKNFLLN